MPSYFTYLSSTLPALKWGDAPAFSTEKFLTTCAGFISERELSLLKDAVSGAAGKETAQPTLKKWRDFETALRNELVRLRAARKHAEEGDFLRRDGYADTWITHIAASAYRTPSILEAERFLDSERWSALDELAAGHYFDIDFLIVYARKLLLLEKWQGIKKSDGAKILEEALKK